jgi:hypothetical protein
MLGSRPAHLILYLASIHFVWLKVACMSMSHSRVQIVYRLSNPVQLLYVFFLEAVLDWVSVCFSAHLGMRQHWYNKLLRCVLCLTYNFTVHCSIRIWKISDDQRKCPLWRMLSGRQNKIGKIKKGGQISQEPKSYLGNCPKKSRS